MDEKNKKKTLTVSSSLKKKIDISSLKKDGKKSFSIEKKKAFRGGQRDFNKSSTVGKNPNTLDPKKLDKEIFLSS